MSAYKLVRPCAKCPFRTDIDGYLRPERAREIAESLAHGAPFPCHETTGFVEDDDGEEDLAAVATSQFCAGALICIEAQGNANQLMRVAERVGLYDAAKLDRTAPVAGSFVEFVQHHSGPEVGRESDDDLDGECCHVCDHGCEAPAGYMIDGMVVPAERTGDVHWCEGGCGEAVCDNCSNAEGICSYCEETAAA